MYQATIRIGCKYPKYMKKSLEPDMENSENIKTSINAKKGYVEIKIEADKISHLKAVLNSYLSLISMLRDLDKAIK